MPDPNTLFNFRSDFSFRLQSLQLVAQLVWVSATVGSDLNAVLNQLQLLLVQLNVVLEVDLQHSPLPQTQMPGVDCWAMVILGLASSDVLPAEILQTEDK